MNTALTLADQARRDLRSLRRTDATSVRLVRRRYSKVLADESPKNVLRFVTSLLDDAGWAERVVAWEVLAAHRGAFARVNDRRVEVMAHGLSDWASVDLFGVTVLGQAWRVGLVSDAKILAWVRSHDRWRRRLALVATVPLNLRARGGTGDPRRTLKICRLLVGDSDDMVVKAMSWSLRELAKRDPKVVEAFLVTEEDRLPARVKREVRNKLTTGLKSPTRPDPLPRQTRARWCLIITNVGRRPGNDAFRYAGSPYDRKSVGPFSAAPDRLLLRRLSRPRQCELRGTDHEA